LKHGKCKAAEIEENFNRALSKRTELAFIVLIKLLVEERTSLKEISASF
jgi:hypothetical protein